MPSVARAPPFDHPLCSKTELVDASLQTEAVLQNPRDDEDLEISLLNNFWERKFTASSFIDEPHRQIEIAAAAEMRVTIKPFAIPK